MFYELERPLNPDWYDLVLEFFEDHGQRPNNVIVESDGPNGKGVFSRVRKKIPEALEIAEDGKMARVQVRGKAVFGEELVFPSVIGVYIGQSGHGRTEGVFSSASKDVSSLIEFSLKMAERINSLGGAFYGHASWFPAAMGPDAYLVGMGSLPKGMPYMALKNYSARLTNWREEVLSRNRLGCFYREVFPINFLTTDHMESRIGDKAAEGFLLSYGEIRRLDSEVGQFVWTVPKENIIAARKELEYWGLILSAGSSGDF